MIYFRQDYKPIKSVAEDYKSERERKQRDFTNLIPDKRMEKVRLPSGFYGYTFLGWDYMAINDNLSPEKSYETQVHEAIHTPDEYETRVLTWWMLEEESFKY